MQINITTRYHYTSTNMAKIKKMDPTTHCESLRKIGKIISKPHRDLKSYHHIRNSLAVSSKFQAHKGHIARGFMTNLPQCYSISHIWQWSHYFSITLMELLKPHSPSPSVPKVLIHLSINSKFKISDTYQIKHSIFHHLNNLSRLWVRFWVWSIVGQNSSPSLDLWKCKTNYVIPKYNSGTGID